MICKHERIMTDNAVTSCVDCDDDWTVVTLPAAVWDMWPDERLGCGLDYADEWGDDPPPEVQALAFASDAERGELLSPLARLRDWARGERLQRTPPRCMNCNMTHAETTHMRRPAYPANLLCWLFVDGRCDARHEEARSA